MTQDAPPPARMPRNWGRLVLFVSLASNLLVAGVVAGMVLHGPRDRDQAPIMRDLGFGPFVQALPRADRRAMAGALRDRAGAFRENRAQMRAMFEAILAALRADPYDHDALTGIVTGQQDKVAERQALGRRLLLDLIAEMSPGDRAAYADELDKSLKRGPRSRR